MKVAVYGSLRAGMGNSHYLDDARYEGKYTLPGYGLYQAFGSIPGIREEDGGSVVVELYSDYNLEALDRLEGEGSLYHRRVVDIEGEDVYIYVYGRSLEDENLIESGDYQDFINSYKY